MRQENSWRQSNESECDDAKSVDNESEGDEEYDQPLAESLAEEGAAENSLYSSIFFFPNMLPKAETKRLCITAKDQADPSSGPKYM